MKIKQIKKPIYKINQVVKNRNKKGKVKHLRYDEKINEWFYYVKWGVSKKLTCIKEKLLKS